MKKTIFALGFGFMSLPIFSQTLGNVVLSVNDLAYFGPVPWWGITVIFWGVILVSGLLTRSGVHSWLVVYDGKHIKNHHWIGRLLAYSMLSWALTLGFLLFFLSVWYKDGYSFPFGVGLSLWLVGLLIGYLVHKYAIKKRNSFSVIRTICGAHA